MEVFNIFARIVAENDAFDNNGIYLVGKPKNVVEFEKDRGKRGGYYFSQREMLESVDLATASKYKYGIIDDEGQRKTYLNIVNFYRDVMKMKININVSNYIFSPRSLSWEWVVWLFDRTFKVWASVENYDAQIDEFAHDLATYGTTLVKRLAKCTERVPLRTLRNTQSAKDLYTGCMNGGFATIENEFHYNMMAGYPDWNTKGLDRNSTYKVFERYGLIPEGLIEKYADMSSTEIAMYKPADDEDFVLGMAIVILNSGDSQQGEQVLFMEKLDENTFPLRECHTEKRDGRWLGYGEVEKQLENQIARNLNANLRRRGILWATKKLFYSTDENIQSNLVMEVRDGDVLQLGNGKTIAPLNTQNQHTNDIKIDDDAWVQNSKENSFAFEVATGEALPSGTPFRLGVVLQQAVAQHYTLVRETFSGFLKRSYFDQLVPIFQKEYGDEHEALIGLGEDDIENLKQQFIDFHTNDRIFNEILANRRPDADAIRMQVQKEIEANAYLQLNVPKKYYQDAEWYMNLNITDDIGPEIADLTSLYTAMAQRGDPRAENVLKQIFAVRGQSLSSILGPAPAQSPAPQAPAQPQNTAQMPPVPTDAAAAPAA